MAKLPNRAKVAELLAFLPGFSTPGRKFLLDDECQPLEGHSAALFPHPIYADDVVAFFMLIGTSPWMDPDYRSLDPERLVADPNLILTATFPEVRALLNLCSRGERFCDGYWYKVLGDGIVQAALKRLETLANQDNHDA